MNHEKESEQEICLPKKFFLELKSQAQNEYKFEILF